MNVVNDDITAQVTGPRPWWGRYDWLLAFVLYLGLTLLMTWPGVARLSTELIGGRDDLLIHQWTYWWVKEALLNGQNPFYTTLLYWPQGAPLTSHNIAWFNILLWMPLQALFGHITAYNLVVLLAFTLNGWTMYLFAREELGHKLAAFTAGVVFAFWPYTMSHYDHANMYVVFGVPLIMLGVRRLTKAEQPLGKTAVWTALAIALTGLIRWQLLLMSLPVVGLYILYRLAQTHVGNWPQTKRKLLGLGASGLLAAVLMFPLASPLIIDQLTSSSPDDAFIDELDWGRTDLAAYVTPSAHNNLLWRDWVLPRYEPFTVNRNYMAYLGFSTLLLLLPGLFGYWRKTWFWLAMAILYVLLALGPNLAVNGEVLRWVPMPYRLVQDNFLLRIIRRPDRLNVFLSVPMAMLVGYGLLVLVRRWQKGARPVVITAVCVALLLVDYAPVPYATTPMRVPDWHASLREQSGEFGIYDLPTYSRLYDKTYMMYQIFHGRPLANGHISRMPQEAFTFIRSTPFLHQLHEDNLMDLEITDVTRQLQVLADADVPYLVIHKPFAHEGLQTIWQDWLAFEPYYEDDEVIVYRTDPRFGEDFSLDPMLSEELGVVRLAAVPPEAVAGGNLKIDIRWGTSAPPAETYTVCLQLRQSEQVQAEQCQPVSDWPTAAWGADEVVRGFYTWPLPVGENELAEGAYQLTAVLRNEAGDEAGDTAVLSDIVLYPYAPSHTTDAVWNEQISLPGYAIGEVNEAGQLPLTLYWQTDAPLSTSYKVFVHLVDEAGQVVAQSDAIPRNWTYPTTAWDVSETVRDPVWLDVTAVPSGTYTLRVGLYDKDTAVRLSAHGRGSVGDAVNIGQVTLD